MEFSIPSSFEPGVAGYRSKGRRAAGARDQLTEMRFYIPGTTTMKKEKEQNGDAGSDEEELAEQNAAHLFYETIMDKAEIGEVAGDTYATFLDILHLTPRLFTLSFDAILTNRFKGSL